MRLLLAVLACALLVGCGDAGSDAGGERKPVLGRGDDQATAAELGFPFLATKNTTRVGGADAVADAAGAALAAFPSMEPSSRPQAVALADAGNWQAAISAAQLLAPPIGAPVLLADGDEVPPATQAALARLRPTGAPGAGRVQVIRVGTAARPEGLADVNLEGASPAALARAVDGLQANAAGRPSEAVLIASQDEPAYAMPAAAWAAKSGHPVLWVTRDAVPAETRRAIIEHRRPAIYVMGPEAAVSAGVAEQLTRLGDVRRVTGADPVTTAIAVARFSDGRFGWNVVDPGHGLAFASSERPADAAAAASMASRGKFGPLLLIPDPEILPTAVRDYLLDIQPGYDEDPVRGVYNHGWLMGDESAISLDVQARIDALLEIQPVSTESTD